MKDIFQEDYWDALPCAVAHGGLVSAEVAAKPDALGRNVKSLDQAEVYRRHEGAAGRRAARIKASRLLSGFDVKASRAVAGCGQRHAGDVASLVLSVETGRHAMQGVRTCGRVWYCPVCSQKISFQRKEELDKLFGAARDAGLALSMLTLTFRHDLSMGCAASVTAMKAAFERFRQRREWRELKAASLRGTVTGTEVTVGENGWHPHLHIIILSEGDAEIVGKLAALLPVWLTCLKAFGLDGNGAALDARDASSAVKYIAKFGPAEEMTLQGAKRGRRGSRTPWQLLDDARDGDEEAGKLWMEYAAAFRGKRQLVWSKGLKDFAAVDEISDEAAAAAEEAEVIVVRSWDTASERWAFAKWRIGAILAAADAGTCLDAAEFGPSDADLWFDRKRSVAREGRHGMEVTE